MAKRAATGWQQGGYGGWSAGPWEAKRQRSTAAVAPWQQQQNCQQPPQQQRRAAGQGKARGEMSEDDAVSRFLSSVLRHNAVSMGLDVRSDGYVRVSDVLKLDFFTSRGLEEADVRRLVESNAKQRFGIAVPAGEQELHIRAHQGHTMKSVADEALLAPVGSAEELPVLCHGTFEAHWPAIQTEGLKTMGRNHIHCVAKDITAEENRNVFMSGTRGECDTVVYIDAAAAMAEGIEFHWSENEVVLTRGQDNVLPPHLFSGVAKWDWEGDKWTHEDIQAAT